VAWPSSSVSLTRYGESMAANTLLDTASQRPATGMDPGARHLILATLQGCSNEAVMHEFFQDRYADFDDYTSAVRQVWGDASADRIYEAVRRTDSERPRVVSMSSIRAHDEEVIEAMLQHMPGPDFRLAIAEAVRAYRMPADPSPRITDICKRRGIPWDFTRQAGFRWIGDEEVEASAMRPALSAIEDRRLASAKSHFDSARSELALGTPSALPQCVHQSACAVESTMKAVLKHRGVPYGEKDAAFKLFDGFVAAGLVPEFMRFCVVAPASPRNKAGGHGADEAPHDVPQEMAEAVLASAAVSIAYLHKLLP
jgi:hypothetical protein